MPKAYWITTYRSISKPDAAVRDMRVVEGAE